MHGVHARTFTYRVLFQACPADLPRVPRIVQVKAVAGDVEVPEAKRFEPPCSLDLQANLALEHFGVDSSKVPQRCGRGRHRVAGDPILGQVQKRWLRRERCE